MKRHLILGRIAMSNPDSVLKSRDITLPTSPYGQSYGFSSSHVWMWKMYHKEGWVPKNWHFRTVVLEKTLASPLDCKENKSVNPKRNQPEYSLEGLMLELRLQYFGHLIRRADSLEKTLMLAKIEGRRQGDNRGWNGWMASLTQDSMDMSLRKFRETVMDREARQPVACHAAVHGVTKNGTWLSDWKTTTTYIYKLNHFAVHQKLT